MKKTTPWIALFLALFAFACGKDDKKTDAQTTPAPANGAGPGGSTPGNGAAPTTGNGANSGTGPTPAGPAIEANVKKLAGTWKMSCTKQENGNYLINSLVIGVNDQNRVLMTQEYFADENCGALNYFLVLLFNVKDDGTATDNMVDLLPTMVSADIVFVAAPYVNWANEQAFCGIGTWVANQKQSIAKKTCNGTTFDTEPSHRITVMGNPDGSISVKAPGDQVYNDYRK